MTDLLFFPLHVLSLPFVSTPTLDFHGASDPPSRKYFFTPDGLAKVISEKGKRIAKLQNYN